MGNIKLRGLTKKFGDVIAVDKLDLDIPEGSFTTLLGPSGCGKTTTLRMIAGLERPTDGEIWIDDVCCYSKEKGIYISAGQRNLGLVFQSYALWPHMTVYANIAFGLKIAHLDKKTVEHKTHDVARRLQIENLLERYPSELSGGQQQRVAIARVLVMESKVLLLDEPLSNLDAKLRMDMRSELKRLHIETGSTVVYVTHDQLEALTMSTEIAVMNHGLLQQLDEPMKVYQKPANLFTADFVGNPRINFLKGKIVDVGGTIEIDLGGTRIPVSTLSNLSQSIGKSITIGIRPEDLSLLQAHDASHIQGKVYSILPAGSEWYMKITIGELPPLTLKVYENPNVALDQDVSIGIKEGSMLCYDEEGNLL